LCHSAPQFNNFNLGEDCAEFEVIGGSSKTNGNYERHGNFGDLVWKKPTEDRFIFNKNGWKIGREGHIETGTSSYFKSSKQNLPSNYKEETWTSSSNGEVTVRCTNYYAYAPPSEVLPSVVRFRRGCDGQLSLFQEETLLKQIEFVDVENEETKTINENRNRNSLHIDSVKATGDCCFEVESTDGDAREVYPDDVFPTELSSNFYIHTIFAIKDCPEY